VSVLFAGAYVCYIYAHCLRVSVQAARFSTTEVAYRVALLLFHFASPLSRRLHHSIPKTKADSHFTPSFIIVDDDYDQVRCRVFFPSIIVPPT